MKYVIKRTLLSDRIEDEEGHLLCECYETGLANRIVHMMTEFRERMDEFEKST